ncbi:protein artemis-like [Centruroides vittatus]|uniref:protein artemis-like n=1 Tax=Centruroides vittatus TaxID=120091 RepID=UPI00350F3982
MCTFEGFVKGYPGISIDRFEINNLNSTIYLLSHCHTDHMKGLDTTQFHERLKKSDDVKIYMSEVSKALLMNDHKYMHLAPYIETIPVKSAITISVPNTDQKIVVTIFPAGHCPGSAMFLIEGCNGNVLYTGDFRLTIKDIRKFKLLHSSIEKVKVISSLYLDCTFCAPEAMYFPTRQESLTALITLIEPWLVEKEHVVYLFCPAHYGYEYIFVELAKKFHTKIHIDDSKMRKYEQISEILNAVTCDPRKSRIHACTVFNRDSNDFVRCKYHFNKYLKKNVLRVKLSVMWFAQHVCISNIIEKVGGNCYRVCYSQHSSLSEIKDIISYLRPEFISPIAIPFGYSENELLRLLSCLQHGNKMQEEKNEKNIFLGLLKKSNYTEALREDGCVKENDTSNEFFWDDDNLNKENNSLNKEINDKEISASQHNVSKKPKIDNSENYVPEANDSKLLYLTSSDSEEAEEEETSKSNWLKIDTSDSESDKSSPRWMYIISSDSE